MASSSLTLTGEEKSESDQFWRQPSATHHDSIICVVWSRPTASHFAGTNPARSFTPDITFSRFCKITKPRWQKAAGKQVSAAPRSASEVRAQRLKVANSKTASAGVKFAREHGLNRWNTVHWRSSLTLSRKPWALVDIEGILPELCSVSGTPIGSVHQLGLGLEKHAVRFLYNLSTRGKQSSNLIALCKAVVDDCGRNGVSLSISGAKLVHCGSFVAKDFYGFVHLQDFVFRYNRTLLSSCLMLSQKVPP